LSHEDLKWADYVFISAMAIQRDSVRAVIAECKEAGVKVVAGGPLFTMEYEQFPDVDHLVLDEAELTLPPFLADLADGCAQPVYTTTEYPDITLTPVPLWELVNFKHYDSVSIQFSRGCPYNCVFCYTPAAFDRRIRCNSVDRVLEEIAYVARRGTGRLWFADPNFSFSEKRVVGILEGILRRNLEVQMWIETRADMLSPDLIRLMKRAGVYLVAMGLESASPNVLPGLDKNLRPERVREATRLALDAGLDVELFSQYALPNEEPVDAMATLQFVKDCGVKIQGNSNAQQMQIYFGSDICSDYARYGVTPLRESFPPYLSIGTEFETRWMPKHEIEKIKQAWRAESLDGGKRIVS